MEGGLYSHLLGEEFSLSDTPSPLQLPEGLHSAAGDTWPCSLGALQPKQGHLLRAESWHQEGFGLGRKIFTLCSFSVNQHWLEKPSNLFSLGTAEHASSSGRAPPSSVQLVTWTILCHRKEKKMLYSSLLVILAPQHCAVVCGSQVRMGREKNPFSSVEMKEFPYRRKLSSG